MTTYQFTCSECGQQIEVNEPMREATLEYGCPVCSSSVSRTDFVEQSAQ